MTEPMPMPPPDKGKNEVEKHVKSKGEKFFDRAVYAGIAGVGTFIVTIFLTDKLKFGSWKGFHKTMAEGFEWGINKIRPGHIKNADLADTAAMTTNLMMGGNLMLIPVGLAEKHKVALVNGLNTAMDDPTPKEAIKQAPKQTWMSLLKSRVVAWITVFGAFVGVSKLFPKAKKAFEEETGELLCQITGKSQYTQPEEVIAALKKDAKNFELAGKSDKLKEIEKTLSGLESRTYRYGKLGALDIFATAAAATLLYLGGHFFARKQEEKKELREEHKALAHGPLHRDALEEIAIGTSDAPGLQVAGSKQHEGMAAAVPTLTQHV